MKKSFVVTINCKDQSMEKCADLYLSNVLKDYFDFSIKPCENPMRNLKDVSDDILNRYCQSDFTIIESHVERTSFIVVKDKNNKLTLGQSRCGKKDEFNIVLGYNLALARACGFKDLEEELVALS